MHGPGDESRSFAALRMTRLRVWAQMQRSFAAAQDDSDAQDDSE